MYRIIHLPSTKLLWNNWYVDSSSRESLQHFLDTHWIIDSKNGSDPDNPSFYYFDSVSLTKGCKVFDRCEFEIVEVVDG